MDGEPLCLLTPGPLTTSEATKQAMLRDWGSRDGEFKAMTRRVRDRLTALAGGSAGYACVPVQGAGTFALEAAVGTLVPAAGRLLVLINGAYGRRIEKIARTIGRDCVVYETPEDTPPDLARLNEILTSDGAITHVAAVHCETTSGILNPIAEIAQTVARHGRRLLIDAMSSFGALPLDVSGVPCDAIISSANKCLEGVPGLSFVIARTDALADSAGNAPGVSLDLHDQWRGFEATDEWRFTPPTQVIAALDQALVEHADEGGVSGRGARYRENCRILVDGMRAMGFATYLDDRLQAPVIVTFRTPADARFVFDAFYDGLRERGFLIYPGKLTRIDSFRIGCIGRIGAAEIEGALAAVRDTLGAMAVTECGPAA